MSEKPLMNDSALDRGEGISRPETIPSLPESSAHGDGRGPSADVSAGQAALAGGKSPPHPDASGQKNPDVTWISPSPRGSSRVRVLPENDSSGRIDSQPTIISKPSSAGSPLGVGPVLTSEMGKALLGEVLGHYELQEFVGGGGMGAVFRSLDTMLNRTVAVKVLAPDQSADEETLRRFKNEAQSAARLDHENIGRVHYVGEDRGWHYIVFEFIDGENLRDRVERIGPLSLAEAVSFTLQLGEALAHASGRDVVHRDIKPSNVLITAEGKAKLVDMGLARLHQVEQGENDLTASGVTLGTFDYISPEQARDPRTADVRSDIYSLGCTLYFMLVGRPPFPQGTVLQKLLQHQSSAPPSPREARPGVPDELLRVLNRMLAKAPEKRYQLPKDLVHDLAAFALHEGLQPVIPGEIPWPVAHRPSPYWERNLPWIVPIAALVAIMLVLNFLWSPATYPVPPDFKGRPTANGLFRGAGARSNPQPVGPNGSPPRESLTNPSSAAGQDSGTSSTATDADAAKSADHASATSPQPADAATNAKGRSSAAGQVAGSRGQANGFFSLPESMSLDAMEQRLIQAIRNWVRPDQLGAFISSLRQSYLDRDTEGFANPRGAGADPIIARRGEWIVTRGGGSGPNEFSSLSQAIAKAKNDDVIELRFDGPLDESAISLSNLRLTIRAGELPTRRYRPVLRFDPGRTDPLAQAPALIAVAGGELRLQNLQIELELPATLPAIERWTLFELRRADALRMQGCLATIRNARSGASLSDRRLAHFSNVSFIDVQSAPATGAMRSPDATAMRKPVEIDVRQSMFRGEATWLRDADAEPMEVRFENSVLSTSERFLEANVGSNDPRAPARTKVELRRATVLARGGFAKLAELQDAARQTTIEFNAYDSIFMGGGAPLFIEQMGRRPLADSRKLLSWTGDHNRYDGFSRLLQIEADGVRETFDVDDWRSRWGPAETAGTTGELPWRRVPPPVAANAFVAQDFGLDRASAEDFGASVDTLPAPAIDPLEPPRAGE